MNVKKLNEILDETKKASAFFSEWNELDRAIAVMIMVCFVLMFAIAMLAIWG